MIVDVPTFESGMVPLFLTFMMTGVKLDGTLTSLPLLGSDDMTNFFRPYNEWALEPHRSLNASVGRLGPILQFPSPPPIVRLAQILSGSLQTMRHNMEETYDESMAVDLSHVIMKKRVSIEEST